MIHTDSYTRRSLSGEQRISPGPTIYESRYWLVEHAYPCRMLGWLVIVLKRHVIAKRADLPPDLKGTRIFEMINVAPQEAAPPEEVKIFCETLRSRDTWS